MPSSRNHSTGSHRVALAVCVAIMAFGADEGWTAAGDGGERTTQASDTPAVFAEVEGAYRAEVDGIVAVVSSVARVPVDFRTMYTQCESHASGIPIRVRCLMVPNPFAPRTAPAIAFVDSAASGYVIQLYRDERLVAAYSLDGVAAGEYFLAFRGAQDRCGEYSLSLVGDDLADCRCRGVTVECNDRR